MKQTLLFVMVLLGASTFLSSDWSPMLDVEVYERSDWIVTGVLQENGKGPELTWTIELD